MAYEIIGEADTRLQRRQVIVAFESCGAKIVEESETTLTAFFAASGMSVYLTERQPNFSTVRAANVSPWTVGAMFRFRYFAQKFQECEADIRCFLEKLADLSDAYFVVSLDFDPVKAIRDADGLRFL